MNDLEDKQSMIVSLYDKNSSVQQEIEKSFKDYSISSP